MKTYNVICKSGMVEHDVKKYCNFTEATEFCNDHNWVYDYNGGLFWDLEIVESGWEITSDIEEA